MHTGLSPPCTVPPLLRSDFPHAPHRPPCISALPSPQEVCHTPARMKEYFLHNASLAVQLQVGPCLPATPSPLHCPIRLCVPSLLLGAAGHFQLDCTFAGCASRPLPA